ncbi:hypothetical protein N8146_01055 [Ascidiaceihabitans sp.]|nr:hypothetical protein [Ascidiaceihabitans sp.]
MVNKYIVFACFSFFMMGQPVWSSCEVERFADLALLNEVREEFSDYSLEYSLQKDAVMQKRVNERRERSTLPIELNVILSGSKVDEKFNETAEARLTYDVNFPLQLLNRKKSFLLDKNYEKRLKNINLEEHIEYLKKTLSWVYSNELSKLYAERLEILVQRQTYLTEKQRQGLSVVAEVSRAKLEIISLKNKILAVESRKEILIFEFENVNTTVLEDLDFSWAPAIEPLSCLKLSYEILLAQDNIAYYNVQKRVDQVGKTLSSNLFVSKDLTNSTSDPTFGINLNLTLIAPKVRGAVVRGTLEKLDQSKRDLRLAAFRLDKLYREQKKVETLITANLEAVDTEIVERNRILEELAIRKALGQTVFDQKSTTLLEVSNLKEVRKQRVFDLYTGWLQFVSVRGLED